MEQIYNKLVRDNIPNIIKGNGEIPITRILDETEYISHLENKLLEETQETLNAKGDDRLEEFADLIEVIKALASTQNATLDEILNIAEIKNKKKGAFNNRILLEKVIDEE